MISKLRVFSLFSLAYGAFNIQNCDDNQQPWLQNALNDVVYVACRATQTLQEALSLPEIPPTVQTILDAFLSSQATLVQYQDALGKSY